MNEKRSLSQLALVLLFFVIYIFELAYCDVFNSQEELNSLLHLHLRVGDSFRKYLKNEEIRIQELKLTQKVFENIENSYKENLLQNPVNAFVVVKTLVKDLNAFLKSAQEQTKNYEELLGVINELRKAKEFPNEEDVKGAALAINRLQDTYKFEVSQMANGFLGAHCCSLPLQAGEFFELGKESFYSKDYPHTMDWMNQVLIFLNQMNHDNSTMNKSVEVDEMKTEANDFLIGAQQIQNTLSFAKKFFTFTTGIELDSLLDQISVEISGDVLFEGKDGTLQGHHSTKAKCEALCREEKTTNANPELKCSYNTRGNKYLLLAPIKEEILSLSPPIFLFHGILHDGEIELIKKLAQPNFETALVSNYATGGSKVSSEIRVSKTAWISEDNEPQIKIINERIGIISQLDLESAEDIQVANYGIGGHYEPHYDFSYGDKLIDRMDPLTGNRMATFMFYMSEVEAGGGTVFPHLNLAVSPIKGTALFWHNLFENGDPDFRTKHAACPVLLGSKWVSNKWIHERGQGIKTPLQNTIDLKFTY